MAQADFNNSTTAPVVSTRRGFLSNATSIAAGGAVLAMATPAIAAAPRDSVDASKASPALRTAVKALGESHDSLEAAKARFNADDAKLLAWEDDNPEPKGKRARKRWARRWRENRGDVVGESWAAQLEAEKHFRAAQFVVAKIDPRDANDLGLMAAVASMYDRVKLASGDNALISYKVALSVIRLQLPV